MTGSTSVDASSSERIFLAASGSEIGSAERRRIFEPFADEVIAAGGTETRLMILEPPREPEFDRGRGLSVDAAMISAASLSAGVVTITVRFG